MYVPTFRIGLLISTCKVYIPLIQAVLTLASILNGLVPHSRFVFNVHVTRPLNDQVPRTKINPGVILYPMPRGDIQDDLHVCFTPLSAPCNV